MSRQRNIADGRSRGGDEERERDALSRQIDKRRTLNLLIQGSAAHSFLTAHHLVADELEAIRPGLTRLYDRFVIAGHLNYWSGDLPLVHGFSFWFWRRAHRPRHPFFGHRLLAEHGGDLAQASKAYLLERGRAKNVATIPGIHYLQMVGVYLRVLWVERRISAPLEQLAKRVAAQIWGIDEERLDGELTANVEFGHLQTPKTLRGKLTRPAVVGYGGVERRDGRFRVVAKARCFPLLVHELCKGTAELVCLHGLNTLDDRTYGQVTEEADQLEHEIWYLQAGAEAWRRLLKVLPTNRPVSDVLMHIARLQPDELDELMMAVMEGRPAARAMLERLGPPEAENEIGE